MVLCEREAATPAQRDRQALEAQEPAKMIGERQTFASLKRLRAAMSPSDAASVDAFVEELRARCNEDKTYELAVIYLTLSIMAKPPKFQAKDQHRFDRCLEAQRNLIRLGGKLAEFSLTFVGMEALTRSRPAANG